MSLSCIIVEDEPLAIEKLTGFINEVSFLDLKASFNNAVKAIEFLQNNSIDLIFLDIRMEKLSGIEFLESLTNPPKVIITSAYSEYAIKGFDLNVIDYLLKPYSFDRFLKAVNKLQRSPVEKTSDEKDCIFINTEYRLEKIQLDNILFIEGMKDYLHIICTNKRIITKKNFSDILDILPESNFIRVHKSYIVAINKIETIERERITIRDKLIPISKTYKSRFYEQLKQLGIL